ncbi:MAG TPA: hypothetical protein VLZ10_13040 [Thermodesulfobacteriota bacterium]|nr:hypothetical protein [Thermodesulfobacteriota bacterium]
MDEISEKQGMDFLILAGREKDEILVEDLSDLKTGEVLKKSEG